MGKQRPGSFELLAGNFRYNGHGWSEETSLRSRVVTTPSTPLCYGPQVTVWVAKHSDLRSQIVGILEISRFGPVISVCEVVRFSMADTCRSSDWDHRSCHCFFRWRWWSNWVWLLLWCHVKYPSIPVLLVELMAPSKIIISLFSQLSLELKNVEKDDAHFLSPYYLSFIIIRTWKLISPLEYKGGREGLVGTLPCVLFTLQKFQKVFTLNR